jgi:hypothetical protein
VDARGYALHGVHRVPGWFSSLDALLFLCVDRAQQRLGRSGDLVEIGVFRGRSALLLGHVARPTEEVVLCDPFDAPAAEADPLHETYYRSVSAVELRRTWTAHHQGLDPVVVADRSEALDGLRAPGSARLVHIDGGHEYEDVRGDLRRARGLCGPTGMVVLDDWRTAHTPGVGAAAWEAVAVMGLVPVLVSEAKLYATWGDEALGDAVQEEVGREPLVARKAHRIAGHDVLQVLPTPSLRRATVGSIPWRLWRRTLGRA